MKILFPQEVLSTGCTHPSTTQDTGQGVHLVWCVSNVANALHSHSLMLFSGA